MAFVLQAQANPHTRECSMEDLQTLHASAKDPQTAKFFEQVMRGLEFHNNGQDLSDVKVEPTRRQPAPALNKDMTATFTA